MVYGENPQEGFFQDNRFVHPGLGFEMVFPEDWEGANEPTQVSAISPTEDAVLILSLSDADDAAAGLDGFLDQEGISGGWEDSEIYGGVERVYAEFSADTDEETVRGEATFIAMDGVVFSLIGYAADPDWDIWEYDIERAVSSFGRLRDREVLNARPQTLQVVTLDEDISLAAYHEAENLPVSLQELARLNRVDADAVLKAGRRIKVVTGDPLPGR